MQAPCWALEPENIWSGVRGAVRAANLTNSASIIVRMVGSVYNSGAFLGRMPGFFWEALSSVVWSAHWVHLRLRFILLPPASGCSWQ